MDKFNILVNFRDKDLRKEGLFVGEGRLLVERSINSGCEVLGLFSDEASSAEALSLAGEKIPVSVCSQNEINLIAGFNFHRGMLVLVKRPEIKKFALLELAGTNRILVLPSINDPGNLGALLRSSLAFGFDTVLIGEKTCDPFNRKALRASMGASLNLRIMTAKPDSIECLSKGGFQVFAAEMKENAFLLGDYHFDGISLALVLGNEYDGIPEEWRKYCTNSMMIKVSSAVDSLNVSVAGSILMWELSRQ